MKKAAGITSGGPLFWRAVAEQLTLAALARDHEKQPTASRDIERPKAQTFEDDSCSTIIAALLGKGAAPSQALEKIKQLPQDRVA